METALGEIAVGAGLEAKVKIIAADPLYSVLARLESYLRSIFIVSGIQLEKAEDDGTLRVEVNPADGTKCDRCWNYSACVGQDALYPTVCERCSPVLHELEAAQGA